VGTARPIQGEKKREGGDKKDIQFLGERLGVTRDEIGEPREVRGEN